MMHTPDMQSSYVYYVCVNSCNKHMFMNTSNNMDVWELN